MRFSPRLAVLGIDHRHIFGMLGQMMAEGAVCKGWWTAYDTPLEAGFIKRFPDLERVQDKRRLLEDPDIDMILIAAIPCERAELAIEAMRAGKDVMVDKPGCTTLEQLPQIQACVAETGRIWSVNFSERFEVPAVTKADELVRAGAIGTVKQTLGIGPHRQNLDTRPDWFFDRQKFGGILCDIGSHQIDQYLYFTGAQDVHISHAYTENTTLSAYPGFQDFGEIVLNSPQGNGYIRVDWFTPDALPTWGDGRLFILGDEGSIELRKYTNIAQPHITDQLFLATHKEVKQIDCRESGMPYFSRLINDIENRTETACKQSHTFRATALALDAQRLADKAGKPETG